MFGRKKKTAMLALYGEADEALLDLYDRQRRGGGGQAGKQPQAEAGGHDFFADTGNGHDVGFRQRGF